MPFDPEQYERAFGMLKPKKWHRSEWKVHKDVVKYLKENYPGVLFISNLGGEYTHGDQMQAQKWRAMQESNGAPDIMIFSRQKGYTGLALELKKDGVKVFTNDGYLYKDDHLEEQYRWLCKLEQEGWLAFFVIGFSQAKRLIDKYFSS